MHAVLPHETQKTAEQLSEWRLWIARCALFLASVWRILRNSYKCRASHRKPWQIKWAHSQNGGGWKWRQCFPRKRLKVSRNVRRGIGIISAAPSSPSADSCKLQPFELLQLIGKCKLQAASKLSLAKHAHPVVLTAWTSPIHFCLVLSLAQPAFNWLVCSYCLLSAKF